MGLLGLLLLLPGAVAQVPVDGAFAAASVDARSLPTSTEAFLIGLQRSYEDPPPYYWTFTADELEVVQTVERWRTYGGMYGNLLDTETIRTEHRFANGMLDESTSLAYMAALSGEPATARSTASMATVLPDANLVPAGHISFDSSGQQTQDAIPSSGERNNRWSFERDWPHLRYEATGGTEPLVLRGDFRVVLYGMEFRVTDANGTSTYETGNGDYRGVDPAAPIYEYKDIRAELILGNAAFTIYPEGYPLHLFLAEATLEVDGSVRFRDADGVLRLGGQETHLDQSHVELQGNGLEVTLAPTGTEPLMRLSSQLSGTVDEAVVDGRRLNVEPTGTAPMAEPPTTWIFLAGFAPIAALLVGVPRAWGSAQTRWRPDAASGRAQRLLNRGRLHHAKRVSAAVLTRHPLHSSAAVVHALALLGQDTPRTAAQFLAPFVGSPADAGELSLLHSVSLRRAGLAADAQRSLAQAVRRYPSLRDAIDGTDLDLPPEYLPGEDLSLV